MSPPKIAEALDQIPYPIAVVTVGRGKVENALTVSWLSQVSFEPPHLMVAIDRVHYSEELVRSTKNFVVNLLRDDQKRLAGQFARESIVGEDKFRELKIRESDGGAAIIEDALAYFDCEVVSAQPVGDHLLVIGKVVDAGVLSPGQPLTTASGIRYQKSKSRKSA